MRSTFARLLGCVLPTGKYFSTVKPRHSVCNEIAETLRAAIALVLAYALFVSTIPANASIPRHGSDPYRIPVSAPFVGGHVQDSPTTLPSADVAAKTSTKSPLVASLRPRIPRSLTVVKSLPVIQSISPNNVTATQTISISGSNFTSTRGTVTIGGIQATISSWGSNSISIKIPSNAHTGTNPVVVTTTAGSSSPYNINVKFAPMITSISPEIGVPYTQVTVTGSGFGTNIPGTVSFNGVAGQIISWSDQQIIVKAPDGAAGRGPVVVSWQGVNSNGITFNYIPTLFYLSNSTVERYYGSFAVVGQNFLPQTGVITLNGVPLKIYSWSNNSISLPVPQDNCTGPIVVKTIYGNSNPVILTINGSTPGCMNVNHPPVANAGANQTVFVNTTVQLDGSGSTDQDGDALTYRWSFVSVPTGSNAALVGATTVKPTFVVDKPGSYTAQLIVNDSHVDSTPSTVVISTKNSAPVANAGPNQTVKTKNTVQLDGSRSSDVDGDSLSFIWTFVNKPVGSNATISDPALVNPTFVTDVKGAYVVQLVVNDGKVSSAPATVTISDVNTTPVANAGPNQTVIGGARVQLNGSASTDIDGDALIYKWSMLSKPAGSAATLSAVDIVNPTFVADALGDYVVQLIVNDGVTDSQPATVTISTHNSPPVANPGTAQTVAIGVIVNLDESASSDPDGQQVTYQWSILSRPNGSLATLSSSTAPDPVFTADRNGNYVVQLIVNDGYVNSSPSTVEISTINSIPLADPGPAQTVTVGDTVILSGTASRDPDGDPLTFKWALLSQSSNGTATLSGATTVSPSFLANTEGEYVIQLIVNDGFADSVPKTVMITAKPKNAAPVVYAGSNQTVRYPEVVNLQGTVTDDGYPEGASVVIAWTKVSGPGTAIFADGTHPSTTVTFNQPGTYVLQLSADDTQLSSASTTTINYLPPINKAPVVSAGADQSIVLPATSVTLQGSATDDGWPIGSKLAIEWKQTSGPAGVVFSDATQPVTNASFPGPGIYLLELSADDSEYRNVASVHITVSLPPQPIANPGSGQSVPVGATVQLNGAGSSDPSGLPLSYQWSFDPANPIPVGSTAVLNGASTATPTFVADKRGTYTILLVVSNGFVSSGVASIIITTKNSPPIANAGADQTATVGKLVQLDGSKSTDVDGDLLTYKWSLIGVPEGSTATISKTDIVNPTITVDKKGEYKLQLIVNDGAVDSAPSLMTISTMNSAPVANAGSDQKIIVGNTVQLDGSKSTDVDGDTLTYSWSFVSRPDGSTVELSDSTAIKPTFVPDQLGTYVLKLVVSDGTVSSIPENVTITTENTKPVAEAGADQSVAVGSLVSLDGSASSDADHQTLTYQWSIITKPSDSTAVLSDASSLNPSFTADMPGTYVLQLIVNDGYADSVPDTVTISTTNSAPVANAGPDQIVKVGDTVQLDGTASFDSDNDSLTYRWAILWQPVNSMTSLSDANIAMPTFVAENAGLYIIQLIVNDGKVDSIPITLIVTASQVLGADPTVTPAKVILPDTAQLIANATGNGNPADVLSYMWSVLPGSPGGATISDSNASDPTVSFVQAGTYTFQLDVSDSMGSTPVSKQISVTVARPLTATPEARPSAILMSGTADLFANATDDGLPGDILSYHWTLVFGSPDYAGISNPTIQNPSVSLTRPGPYTFELTVSDSHDSTPVVKQITITVKSPLEVNPTATPARVILPSTTTLMANVDIPGMGTTGLQYQWMLLPGSPAGATISNPTEPVTVATFTQPGYYTFKAIVYDPRTDITASKTVAVAVAWPLKANPTATPTIFTIPGTVALTANANDDGLPGDILSYHWTAEPADGVTFSDPTSASPAATFISAGARMVQVTVSDSHGSAPVTKPVPVTIFAVGPIISLSVKISPEQTGPNLLNMQQSLVATVVDQNGLPASNQIVTFTVTGANPRTESVVSEIDGKAAFNYTGTAKGIDTIVASVLFEGKLSQSNSAAITWINPTHPITTSTVHATFYPLAGDGTSLFNIEGLQPTGTADFPVIGFDADDSTSIGANLGATEFAGMMDVTIDVNDRWTGTIERYLGQLDTRNFQAVYTGNYYVKSAGPQTIRVKSQQGFSFGIQGASYVAGDRFNVAEATALKGYRTIGGYAESAGDTHYSGDFVVSFPTPGIYPYEFNFVARDVQCTMEDLCAGVLAVLVPDETTSRNLILPPLTSIALTPKVHQSQDLGYPLAVEATLLDERGKPLPNVEVTLSVAGETVQQLTATTNNSGIAAFQYSGITGIDYLQASAKIYGETIISNGTNIYWIDITANITPVVDAGPNQTINFPRSANLSGWVWDDGLPLGAPLSIQWSQVSGPGIATFAAPSSPVTQVSFSESGTYVLQLSASDTELTGIATVNVLVVPQDVHAGSLVLTNPTNPAPIGGTHSINAVLTDANGYPVADRSVQFVIDGENGTSGSATTDIHGTAVFTYVGTNSGTDTATSTLAGNGIQSNSVSIDWVTPSNAISSSTVQATFFNLPEQLSGYWWDTSFNPLGGFSLANNQQPTGTGAYPVLAFNASDDYAFNSSANLIPYNWSPQTDLTVDVNDQWTGTLGVTLDNGAYNVADFQAVYRGFFVVAAPGSYVISTYGDGSFFGIQGATYVSGAQFNLPATTALNHYPVLAGYNANSGPTLHDYVIDFPSAGTYPYEFDYYNPPGYQLYGGWNSPHYNGQFIVAVPYGDLGKRIVLPPIVSVALTPNTTQQFNIGYRPGIKLTVLDIAGQVAPNIPVKLVVTGVNAQEVTGTTDANGVAILRYQGVSTGDDRLQASAVLYGQTFYSNETWITWNSSDNSPPIVYAGPQQTVTFPGPATLSGAVYDDGLPIGLSLTSQWSQVSGPGMVIFADAFNLVTQVSFSAPGIYMLRLSANDGAYTSNSDTTVIALSSYGVASNVILMNPMNPTPIGGPHELKAAVTDSDGLPVVNQVVQFTVAGVNPTSGTAITDLSGIASFNYTGSNTGVDTAFTTLVIDGNSVQSNTVTIDWVAPAMAISTSNVRATFYPNSFGTSFSIGGGLESLGTGDFSVIAFNASDDWALDSSAQTSSISPQNDLLVDVRDYWTGTQVERDTTGRTYSNMFQAAYTGHFVVAAAGTYEIDVFANDGYFFGIEGATYVSGPQDNLPNVTALKGYSVIGGRNNLNSFVYWAQTTEHFFVSFPAPGTYAYEFDYFVVGLNFFASFIVGTMPHSGDNSQPLIIPPVTSLALTPKRSFSLDPSSSAQLQVTLLDAAAAPVEGKTVTLTIAGTNEQQLTAVTDTSGVAAFTYSGKIGEDRIRASAPMYGQTIISNEISLAWLEPSLVLTPQTAQTLDPRRPADIKVSLANSATTTPIVGTIVMLTITGTNARTLTAITDDNGIASFSYLGAPGNDTVQASVSMYGQLITSNDLSIKWLAPSLVLTPEAKQTLNIGDAISFQASMLDPLGLPVPDAYITLKAKGTNSKTLYAITDSNGVASFSYRGKAGDDTVQASIYLYGATSLSNEVQIHWNTIPNRPPVVIAGPDQIIELPGSASLTGSVVDDNIPVGAALTIRWSEISGPGIVTFSDYSNPLTTAWFSAPGLYILQLLATDTQFTTTSTLQVRVSPAGLTPSVITLTGETWQIVGNTTTIQAVVADRSGYPAPQRTLQLGVSGANTVSQFATTDINGVASFTYTGTASGVDSIAAGLVGIPAGLTSNVLDLHWLRPLNGITTTTVTATYFPVLQDQPYFDISWLDAQGTREYPSIGFNAYDDAAIASTANLTGNTLPTTDLTVDVRDRWIGTIEQVDQNGTSYNSNFQAVYSGNFIVAAAGDYKISVLSAGPFLFGAQGATYVDGPQLQTFTTTPWEQYPVLGGTEKQSSGRYDFVLNFPKAGVYPYEFDYASITSPSFFVVTVPGLQTESDRLVLPPAGSIALSPNTKLSQQVATDQTLQLTVTDMTGVRVEAAPVAVVIRGANAQTLTGSTDQNGTLTLSYTANNEGEDRLQASAVIDGLTAVSNELIIHIGQQNQPPTANAGPNLAVIGPEAVVMLNGSATDDGMPNGALDVSWTEISGPISVSLTTPNQPVTQATFAASGTYVLRLTASDGEYTKSADVTVVVYDANGGKNQVPYVSAGPDQSIVWPMPVQLNGVAVDDGLPNGTLGIIWRKLSGPGNVTFGNPSSATTTAAFDSAGTYSLELSADDGELVSRSIVHVEVGKLNGYRSNKGTDFWIMFPAIYDGYCKPQIFITGDKSTTGVVEMPGFIDPETKVPFIATFSVVPGEVTTVTLPKGASQQTSDSVEYKGIHITAQDEVAVYGLDNYTFGNDGYLALPVTVLGKDYVVPSYPTSSWGGDGLVDTELSLVAAYDWTIVTIIPSTTILGRQAKQPFSFVLNQGRTYQLKGDISGQDLTGTIIMSDKPVAVFSGNQCADIPRWARWCNHIVEQIPPTDLWGTDFLTVPTAMRTYGDFVRIIAAQDGTTVSLSGSLPEFLNRGQYQEVNLVAPSEIHSDKPILVVQYEPGKEADHGVNDWSNTGDPSMAIVPPYEQFGGRYTVSTPSRWGTPLDPYYHPGLIPVNFINMVAPTSALGKVLIDGMPVDSSLFSQIGSSNYSGAQVPILAGTHVLNSSSPFGATIYGLYNDDAYSYTAGLTLSQPPAGTQISIFPKNITQRIGTTACAVATVIDNNGVPMGGIGVAFQVSGTNPHEFSFVDTDASGQASYCYIGEKMGVDTVAASIGIASDGGTLTWTTDSPNQAPSVSAGPNQILTLTKSARLFGVVTDDGVPSSDLVSATWTTVSGPGSVSFDNSNAASTKASFSAPGTYVLRLTGSDSQLTASSDVTINVNPEEPNQPPVVSAGSDQYVTIPGSIMLNGTATDDDLPSSSKLSVYWSYVSGPWYPCITWLGDGCGKIYGKAIFSRPTELSTSVTFDGPGTYVLRLTAEDGQYTSYSDVTVAVDATNRAPVISDIGSQTLIWPTSTLTIPLTVQDDGLPTGSSVIVRWSQTMGPAGVVFSNPTLASTDVTFPQVGAYNVRLSATDGELTSTRDVAVLVYPSDRAPTVNITPSSQTVSLPNAVATLTGSITEHSVSPGIPKFQWSQLNGPAPVTFSAPAELVTRVSFTAAGSYRLQLAVTENGLTTAVDAYVQVNPANQAPVVSAGPNQSVSLPNATVTLNGSASDDGLPASSHIGFQWTQLSGPESVTFSPPTAARTQVTFATPGTYSFRLTADDSQLSASSDVVITVFAAPQNLPPVVSAGPNQSITIPSNSVVLRGSATDDGLPTGSKLTYLWTQLSGPGTAFIVGPNNLSVSIWFSVPGIYHFQLSASDSQLTSSSDVYVTVNAATINQAPVVNIAQPAVIKMPTNSTTLTGTVSDDGLPVGGSLSMVWGQVSGPALATFSSPNTAVTQVTCPLAGEYTFMLMAGDSQLVTQRTITLKILAANQAPALTISPSNSTVSINDGVTLSGIASDDGGSAGLTYQWTQVYGPYPAVIATPDQPSTKINFAVTGTYYFNLTASDSQLTTSASAIVTVQAPTGPPPAISLQSPIEGQEIREPITIIGSINASNGGANWILDYSLNSSSDPNANKWTILKTGGGNLNSGALAVFDPTTLLNGSYTLRLTATDLANQTMRTSVTVTVVGNMKVGNFTLAFNDLTVPLAGLPIQVIRTYDSRDQQIGDFGRSWNIGIRNVRVEKSGIIGKGWYEETIWSGYSQRSCLSPTSDRTVAITFPDGKIYKFNAKSVPECQSYGIIEAPTIAFVQQNTGSATAGATLTPVGETSLLIDGSIPGPVNIIDFTGSYVDYTKFVLTTAEGYKYDLDQKFGVTSLTDPNGNTLTINDNGVFHSSGASVAFTRDSQHRITQISDPDGAVLNYTYDYYGNLASVTDRSQNKTQFLYQTGNLYGTRVYLDSIIDPRGVKAIRNTYDDAGRLTSSTDANGKTITYAHDLAYHHETITDRLGHSTLYEYDDDGNVTRTTDALGQVTSATYDGNGNKLSETNPLGKTTTYAYDGMGNRTRETDPLGNTTTYTYNKLRQVVTVTDPLGKVTTNTYDLSNGNLKSTKDALGKITGMEYWPNGQPKSTTDALNNTTAFEYDGSGNLRKQTDALQHVSEYSYDTNGNKLTQTVTRTLPGGTIQTLLTKYEYDKENRLTRTTFPDNTSTRTEYNAIGKQWRVHDAQDRVTTYDYDEQGRLKKTSYPDNTFDSTTYDEEGRRKTSTDRGNRTTSFVYDEVGRLTETHYPDGSVTRTEYDAAGQVKYSYDAAGHKTEYVYDDAGRRKQVIDALGHVTEFTYDAAGRQTEVKDARNNTTKYHYDDNGRQTSIEFADGTSSSTGYDEAGRMTSKTDQAGKITWYGYDKLGRLTSVTQDPVTPANPAGLNLVTNYGYDELGSRVSQTDANNHKTSYDYDQLGRRVKRTLPLGQVETYSYNQSGTLKTRTDFNGRTTTYDYDNLNRLLSKTADPYFAQHGLGAAVVSFTYTADGRRETMTDASGKTTYTYDPVSGRLTSKQTPEGTLNYAYDNTDNLLSITSSNTNGAAMAYTYDELNRLSTVTVPGQSPTTYSYDEVGNLAGYTYPNGVATSYTYDKLNRLTDMSVKNAGTALSSYTYTLGAAGNRKKVVELSGRTVEYGYDNLYRLKSETITGDLAGKNGVVGYTYDAVGNRKERTSTLEAVPASGLLYYDANDRTSTDTYDDNGNTISQAGIGNQYDFENRLIQHGAMTFTYDGDGNRVAKTFGGVTTQFLVDTANPTGYAQVVEELTNGTVSRTYAYGLDLISQSQTVNSAWKTSWYGYDGHGSVRVLTDDSGAVTDTYTYDAFGNLINQTGSTPNNYLFAGEQYDWDLGLYYNRARYLDVRAGRFWGMDEFEGDPESPLSLHRYIYAASNPINGTDPTGYASIIEMTESEAVDEILNVMAQIQKTIDVKNRITSVFELLAVVKDIALDLSGGGPLSNAFEDALGELTGQFLKRYSPAHFGFDLAESLEKNLSEIATRVARHRLLDVSKFLGDKNAAIAIFLPTAFSLPQAKFNMPFSLVGRPVELVFGGGGGGRLLGFGADIEGDHNQFLRIDFTFDWKDLFGRHPQVGEGSELTPGRDDAAVWHDGIFHYHVPKH